MPGASGGGRIAARLAGTRLRTRLAMAGAAAVILLAAIGGGALVDAARRPDNTRQYLGQAPGFVAFVEFIADGPSLSGTLDLSTLARGATVSANYEYPFTGTFRSSRIRIDLASLDPTGTSVLVGSMRSGDLVLPLWQSDGPVVSRTLAPSGEAAYQAALSRVDALASVNAENDLEVRAIAGAASRLNGAYRTVVADQSRVAGYDAPFAEDVTKAGTDYGQTLLDAQAAEQSSHATCPAQAALAVQAQSDVISDAAVVVGDQETLAADLTGAGDDLTALDSAETAYRQALARAPSHPGTVPPPGQVAAAEHALSAEITASRQTMQGYVAEASGYAQQAQALARTAGQSCG